MPEGSEIRYLFYDDLETDTKMISKELEKIGIKGAYEAYKMIRVRAFRSDLWRWMALWYYGGIYIDAKFGFQMPVSDWVDFENDEFILCPCTRTRATNGLIVSNKFNPISLLVI
jgi:mannosyltransferase OCH1-like enzyme